MGRGIPEKTSNKFYHHVLEMIALRHTMSSIEGTPRDKARFASIPLTGRTIKEEQEDAARLWKKLTRMKQLDLSKLLARAPAQIYGEFAYAKDLDNGFYDTRLIFGLETRDSLVYTVVDRKTALPNVLYLDCKEQLAAHHIRDIPYDGRFNR